MEFTTYLRFVLVLVLVIGMILGLAWLLNRFGLMGGLPGTMGGGRKRRLGIVEAAAIDGRHRVVLVRRDDVEHLMLVGPNTSQVIESGITSPDGEPSGEQPQGLAVFSQFLPQDKEP